MPIFLVAQQSLMWKYFAVRANSEEQAQERAADKGASFEIGKLLGAWLGISLS